MASSYNCNMEIKTFDEVMLGPQFSFEQPGQHCETPQVAKIDLLSEFEAATFTSMPSPVLNRGKGRPKGYKNNKQRERRNKNILDDQSRRSGHWSSEENKRYHWFLELYHRHFICKEMRRLDKIFKTMAVFIGSREAEQCRSHHQKMQKKYHTFSRIILYLRRLHYGTEDSRSLSQDLQLNQVPYQGSLMTRKRLLELQGPDSSTPIAPQPQQMTIDTQQVHNPAGVDSELNLGDFMGENYEFRLDLDSLFI